MTERRSAWLWWGTLCLLALSVLVNVAQASRLRTAVAHKPSNLIGRSARSLVGVDRSGRCGADRLVGRSAQLDAVAGNDQRFT